MTFFKEIKSWLVKYVPSPVKDFFTENAKQLLVAIGIGAGVAALWYFYPNLESLYFQHSRKVLGASLNEVNTLIQELKQQKSWILQTPLTPQLTAEVIAGQATEIQGKIDLEQDKVDFLREYLDVVNEKVRQIMKATDYKPDTYFTRRTYAIGTMVVLSGIVFYVIKSPT